MSSISNPSRTRALFTVDIQPYPVPELRQKDIDEAAESFECPELRDAALLILRNAEMTNHSELITESKTI